MTIVSDTLLGGTRVVCRTETVQIKVHTVSGYKAKTEYRYRLICMDCPWTVPLAEPYVGHGTGIEHWRQDHAG
jgi:hypothetical protein